MYPKNIELKSKEFFSHEFRVDDAKIKKAVENAIARLEMSLDRFYDELPLPAAANKRYKGNNTPDWKNGMAVGMYWLAYMITKDDKFKKNAENLTEKFIAVADDQKTLNDHDTGFKITPSCVAAYKITGNERAKEAAIKAADILMDHICPVNGFIIRAGKNPPGGNPTMYRMLVDSMMNIHLLFWATEVTGDKKYSDAAIKHYELTAKYLVREDGSSYHHYQFDPETNKPVKGVTLQGFADDSCWSRGHSWLMYGYPSSYRYTGREDALEINRAVSYYFLDNLPENMVPYWDFDFNTPSLEPRDSSASAIASCGLLQAADLLPEESEDKAIFKNAAHRMVNALIDLCENKTEDRDGLIFHVTHAKPFNENIDGIEIYGDYFYLEALARLAYPELEMFW